MTRESVGRIMQSTGRTEAQALDAILRTTPQRRLIEADEVAEAVAFLCTYPARGINGEALVIDGGELRS
jgi:NAD(P)-dependent dehydrogenase (short-subunit alcohol dehydrogenase family)